MALSNLRNEPRREITEQFVGITFISIVGLADYGVVRYLGAEKAIDIAFFMFIGAAFLFGASIFMFIIIHALGELVCGWMANIGFDPRPKQRYPQRYR